MADYVLDCVNAVRATDPNIWLSVRVSQTLLATSRGLAFMRGRDYVAPEDVQHTISSVMAHRLPPGLGADVNQIISSVIVPVDAGS
jgi:MoxR-like ATPase